MGEINKLAVEIESLSNQIKALEVDYYNREISQRLYAQRTQQLTQKRNRLTTTIQNLGHGKIIVMRTNNEPSKVRFFVNLEESEIRAIAKLLHDSSVIHTFTIPTKHPLGEEDLMKVFK